MEKIKKTILQAVTTGTTVTGGTIIIPDLSVVYHLKIGLKQVGQDIGFFDAFTEPPEPEPPVPPTETFYLVDSASNPYVDDNNDNFIYE
jgi:hypothetical protein